MNDPEKSIETILSGLRTAEPAAGMEARLLERLAAREMEVPHCAPGRRRWPRWQPATIRLMGAAALLAVGVTLGRHVSSPVPGPAPRDSSLTRPEPRLPVRAGKTELRTAGVPRATAKSAGVPSEPVPVSRASEVQLLSFPAPALPLTEQEKLLLQVAHRGEPQQITPLNQVALVEARDRDATTFGRPFGPPEPVERVAPSTPDTPPPEPATSAQVVIPAATQTTSR